MADPRRGSAHPGGLMLAGLFFLKESPRWLMKKGRQEEALASLLHQEC